MEGKRKTESEYSTTGQVQSEMLGGNTYSNKPTGSEWLLRYKANNEYQFTLSIYLARNMR